MMGCSGCRSYELNMHDYHLKAENLDPAVVNQNPSTTTTYYYYFQYPPESSHLFNNYNPSSHSPTNMSPLINHHSHYQVRASSDEQGMRMDLKDQAAAAGKQSSRWKPTAGQLLALEEIYQRGIKTLTAKQIQQVTAQLRQYGKIEGKNVFYWFQNHRARERQKQRCEMMIMNRSSHSNKQQAPSTVNETLLESKQFAGWTRTSLEVEQMKWTPFSNCTSTLSEEYGNSSMQRAAADMAGMGTRGESGWTEYEERVVQSLQERAMSELVLKSHPASSISQIALYQRFGVVLTPNKLLGHHQFADNHGKIRDETTSSNDQKTTLELFPLHSENLKGVNTNYLPITTTADTTTADHFMEADQFFI